LLACAPIMLSVSSGFWCLMAPDFDTTK